MKKNIKEIEVNVLSEKIKYIQENLSRAVDIQNKIMEATHDSVICSVAVRNYYIDRNEYLNVILKELNSLGYDIEYVRPWQKDVSKQMCIVVHFFEEVREIKKSYKMA